MPPLYELQNPAGSLPDVRLEEDLRSLAMSNNGSRPKEPLCVKGLPLLTSFGRAFIHVGAGTGLLSPRLEKEQEYE